MTYEISTLSHRLYLCRHSFDFQNYLSLPMMRLLFTPNPQAFYCYMETDDDEISLFVDDVSFELFPDEFFTIVDNDPWKVIQVVYPGGAKKIDTTGYINKLSETLSKVGIFTIFFSTFSSDMMIIKEESIDLAYELVSRIGLDSEDDSCDSEDDEEDFLASPLKPPLRILSFQINDLELFTAPLLKTFLNPKYTLILPNTQATQPIPNCDKNRR
eukprot:TRINITY_DN3462_c0_g1_i1.p1 TRINITY_DN3462_c0_g1~~TRINITY_DN3462_c0_g1_i1.p1  ORF type:complete len:225 (+),score=36.48 TRINITY_DN3462_c0_g1_i1:34-675(+)